MHPLTCFAAISVFVAVCCFFLGSVRLFIATEGLYRSCVSLHMSKLEIVSYSLTLLYLRKMSDPYFNPSLGHTNLVYEVLQQPVELFILM